MPKPSNLPEGRHGKPFAHYIDVYDTSDEFVTDVDDPVMPFPVEPRTEPGSFGSLETKLLSV